MASAKGLLLGAVGRFVLREARVDAIREVAPRFRAIRMSCDHAAAWTPGDKIQVLLPSRDVRTYTPSAWETGAIEIVAFDHAAHGSPGARWSREVRVGDAVRFVGPQRSLARTPAATVLFGDETSIGLAFAFGRTARLTCIFEGSARDVLASATWIEREPHDAHLAAIATQIAAHAGAEIVLSGRAQSIQIVQRKLRDAGRRIASSKPYWSVGKTGLD